MMKNASLEKYRLLRFGGGNTGTDPREGFTKHGPFRFGRFRRAEVVMCYPQGEAEAARRLFRLLEEAKGLTGLTLRRDERRWLAYDAGDPTGDGLMRGVYDSPMPADDAACRLFVLLVPSLSAGLPWRAGELFIRLRMLLPGERDFCPEPVYVHEPGSEAFARRLPALALRLLFQVGGMPWVPVHRVSPESSLLLGLSCSAPLPVTGRIFSTAFRTAADDGSYIRYDCVEHHPVHCEEHRFTDCLDRLFIEAYNDFLTANGASPLRRLVLCCHAGFPLEELLPFRSLVERYLPGLPVLTAQVRSSAGTPGVTPHLLHPSGELSPLPEEEMESLTGLLCRSAWADPLCLDGASLPSELLQADRLLRLRIREWKRERAYRAAILPRIDNLTF